MKSHRLAPLGMDIYENPAMVVPGKPERVRRTWRERLFSLPWRPLQATRVVIPMVPDPQIYGFNTDLLQVKTKLLFAPWVNPLPVSPNRQALMAHPETIRALMENIERFKDMEARPRP